MNNSYVTIEHDQLVMQHDNVIPGENCRLSIGFIRTLRIPDDNKKYNLPPGLGNFPLKHVEDYKNVPENWQQHGGIFLPMYQSEAMWLRFNSKWPFAIKIAAGKINAVSGESWNPHIQSEEFVLAHDMLARSPEEQAEYMEEYERERQELLRNKKESKPDYVVSPTQPWLDGFNVGKGVIRQFVAMPLGDGYTVEEQITGKAEHGGLQIIAYPMKKEYYEKLLEKQSKERAIALEGAFLCQASASASKKSILRASSASADMGLGAGGFMKQDIYDDPYGADAWDLTRPLRVYVHLLNSLEYKNVTGEHPPTKPLTPVEYQRYNYPWFDYYSDNKVLEGSDKLSKVDSIASLETKKNENVLGDNTSIQTPHPILLMKGKKVVKSGKW